MIYACLKFLQEWHTMLTPLNYFLLAVAFALQYAGLLAERWYFFADANHPQNLYYQSIS
jgi:DMSO reductase anchor subunit